MWCLFENILTYISELLFCRGRRSVNIQNICGEKTRDDVVINHAIAMDQTQDYFLSYNKLLEDKLDILIHNLDNRIDKLYNRKFGLTQFGFEENDGKTSKTNNSLSHFSFLKFKTPYIKDIKNFGAPPNREVRQIQELTGAEDIESLIKSKGWSRDTKKKLVEAVLDHYSQRRIIELIKQKNILHHQLVQGSVDQRDDINQKIDLVNGQIEQIRAKKDIRIFLPDNRNDPSIDWCSISAKLKDTDHDPVDCRLMWSNNLHCSINKDFWTKEEDECLASAVEKFGTNDWDSVARVLNSNRLPWQCCSHYHQQIANNYSSITPLSDEDTDKMIEVVNLCRIGNFVPWNQVMHFLQYHSLLQVRYQWIKLFAIINSNRPWTHQEDILLLKAIEAVGDKDWHRIASCVPGRSNKSCRERYTMRLKYSSRVVGGWIEKEDRQLRQAVEQFGPNWSVIARHFEGRNAHQLRSRYELLKGENSRKGPLKHRKLLKNLDGSYISINSLKRMKPQSELEIDNKLCEIFSTYSANVKISSKNLICRSGPDEMIYQTTIQVLADSLNDRHSSGGLLYDLISRAVQKRVTFDQGHITPSITTLNGYKAWLLQQDYLNQVGEESIELRNEVSTPEYQDMLKVITKLFLWPAILARTKSPALDFNSMQAAGIIDHSSKNLYKIRSIQTSITSIKNQFRQ